MNVKELAAMALTNNELGILIRLLAIYKPAETEDAIAWERYAIACGCDLSELQSVAARGAEALASLTKTKHLRAEAARKRWENQKPLTDDALASSAGNNKKNNKNTESIDTSNTSNTKRLTPQQQSVSDVFAVFARFDVSPPSGGIVAKWIVDYGAEWLLAALDDIGGRGLLTKPVPYLAAVLRNKKESNEPTGTGRPAYTGRTTTPAPIESKPDRPSFADYGGRTIEDLIKEGKLPALRLPLDGGSNDVM